VGRRDLGSHGLCGLLELGLAWPFWTAGTWGRMAFVGRRDWGEQAFVGRRDVGERPSRTSKPKYTESQPARTQACGADTSERYRVLHRHGPLK
jgi:hypothetical protein